jgi:membrane protein implicated in regulation of membrane protease activity
MSLGNTPPSSAPERQAPPTDRGKAAIAVVLLLIPLVALMWVPSYARETPRVAGFPFFFWYQFLWVFVCSGCTYAAYRMMLAARPSRTARREEGER